MQTAMAFFMGRGLTGAQAAGIVGNMQVESGRTLDPHARNRLGYTGIVQWDPTLRWPRENEFAKAIGKDKFALATELRYAAWELGLNNEWSGHPAPYAVISAVLKKTRTADAAAQVIFDQYEAPMDGSLPKRQRYARYDAAKYGSGGSSGEQVSDSTCSSGGGTVDALQQTVLSYAHHTWAPDGRLKQTSGYAKAVARAQQQNRFVGQSEATAGRPVGDDCAAFIAVLMHDSGWDPSYDYHDKLPKAGYVPTQQEWLTANWKSLGRASTLKVSDLRVGDIGISNGGGLTHVWIYVGSIPGFHGTWAEASYSYGTGGHMALGFAPEARQADGVLYSSAPDATYYRRPARAATGS